MSSSQPHNAGLLRSERDELLTIFTSFRSLITTSQEPEAHPNGVSTSTEALSQREREVLSLVVLGKNNSEIAQELFISLNTVTRHMTNIFAKTGTSNRVAAAVYAARLGLT